MQLPLSREVPDEPTGILARVALHSTVLGSRVRFRVVTPDHHPIAVTVEPALAAATALAVARHHASRYAAIAASDGR